jgi:hypothetical protein
MDRKILVNPKPCGRFDVEIDLIAPHAISSMICDLACNTAEEEAAVRSSVLIVVPVLRIHRGHGCICDDNVVYSALLLNSNCACLR